MGHKPKVPRKKRPKDMTKAVNSGANLLKWSTDPELRAIRNAKLRASNVGRPLGLNDGVGLKNLPAVKAKAQDEAQRIKEYLMANETFKPDNNLSEEAFATLLTVLREPGQTRDRITAAAKVLEYVQKKPQTQSEVTLNKAESFLEAVLAETNK